MSMTRRKKRKLRRQLWEERRHLLEFKQQSAEKEADERERLIDKYWSQLELSIYLLKPDGPLAHEIAREVDAVLGLELTAKLNDFVERVKRLRRPQSPIRQPARILH